MSTTAAANTALSKMDFLTLLTTQLKYQDPTAPTDQEAFIGQISQMSMVESMQELKASFGQMLKLQEVSQGVNLVGKSVEFFNPDSGGLDRGQVSEITMNDGKLAAVVGDRLIDINLIKSISA
jgi:flagellar basal-body rod modification protein FlgD